MQTFSSRFSPSRATNKDGIEVDVPPLIGLAIRGPRMPIEIGVSPFLESLLKSQEKAIPQAVSGSALIDTGATFTSIDESLARMLDLPVVDSEDISTPSHQQYTANVYSGSMISLKDSEVRFDAPKLLGVELATQGIQVLFGRDFLSMGILIYNGADGSFSFSMC